MYGIALYTQIIFLLFLLWATSAALYMGVFHAHHAAIALGRKIFCGGLSAVVSCVLWFFMASWTYLSW